MDNTREQGFTTNSHKNGERRGFEIEDLERDRRHIIDRDLERHHERQVKQTKKRELHTVTYTAEAYVVGSPIVIFDKGLHLPEEASVGSVYVENQSTSSFFMYEGPGGRGRVISYINPKTWRITSIADMISSISIVRDSNVTQGSGLLIVTLFSHKWAPAINAIP